MKAIEATFEGGVLRPVEALELEDGTKVLMHLEVIDVPYPTRPLNRENKREPVLFDSFQTGFKVITDDDDLTKVAVNYWPKESSGAKIALKRAVRRSPSGPPPTDENDLLVMDDDAG